MFPLFPFLSLLAEPSPPFPAARVLIALLWEFQHFFFRLQLLYFYLNGVKYGKGAEIPLIIFYRWLIFTRTTRPIDLSIAALCSILGLLFSGSWSGSHGKFKTVCSHCRPASSPQGREQTQFDPFSSVKKHQKPLFLIFFSSW